MERMERKDRKFPKVPEETLLSEELADVSLYGEFIPNFHHWTSFENMEKRTHYLEDAGKGKLNNKANSNRMQKS